MKLSEAPAAVITGGASGLGAATARLLAASGVKVALLDLGDGSALAEEIGGTYHKADVTDEASLKAAFEAARAAHGQERIMVNCAGVAPAMKTISRGELHPFDKYAKTIDINLTGTFRASALSAIGMTTLDPVNEDGERGVIIMTASVAAFDGQVGQVAYAASKAGVAGLTLPLAREMSQFGIRVLTIAPGIMETPMLKGLPEKAQASLGEQVPFPKRLGKPEEYADLAKFIIENGLINGEVIRLDGAIRMAPR